MNIPPLNTEASPRAVLLSRLKSYMSEPPIRGGWGYSMQDACILDNEDPDVVGMPFDWLGWEKYFIEKRIHEELIHQRADGERFSGIELEKQKQTLMKDGDRYFDHLIIKVTALPNCAWEELKASYEGPNGVKNPNFAMSAHLAKHELKTVCIIREYWFDITGRFR
jgi:hypothetical protein